MYNIKTHKFHKIYIYPENKDEKPIGPFNRFEKEQLQQIVDKINQKDELLTPIQKICHKYKIPIEDLPETLEEYISRDNE